MCKSGNCEGGCSQEIQKSCPIQGIDFMTPEEIQLQKVITDIKQWLSEGFSILDFIFPEGIKIDCSTASNILKRANIKQ